jgi:RNA polymerase sigma factor (TIGR02999 family)
VTRLLRCWAAGDASALDHIVPLVETELRSLARRQLRREPGGEHLDSASLVNEAYLRLAGEPGPHCANRAHFLGIAARVMRRIAVERARRRIAGKRGGDVPHVRCTSLVQQAQALPMEEVLTIHDALGRLEALSERQSRILEMRVFGGLIDAEIGAALDVSERTVQRELRLARAWLYRELAGTA